MAGDPDYQPMKTELDALATATAAIEAAVDLARALTVTTSYEEETSLVTSNYDAFLATATYLDILNITGKGVLTQLDFYTAVAGTRLYLIVDGENVHMPRTSSLSTTPYFTPTKVNDAGGECALIKNGTYDTGNNDYNMYLTRKIYFNTSLRLRVYQSSGSNKIVSYGVSHRIRT